MKQILIAGDDRTTDILPESAAPGQTPDANPAAVLLQARHEAEYLSALLAKLRTESGLRTTGFNHATRPGPLGRLQGFTRRFLWKLLRHQHDHMAFQQNAVNAETAAALEYLRAEYRRDLDRLALRLDALESQASTPPAEPRPTHDHVPPAS